MVVLAKLTFCQLAEVTLAYLWPIWLTVSTSARIVFFNSHLNNVLCLHGLLLTTQPILIICTVEAYER